MPSRHRLDRAAAANHFEPIQQCLKSQPPFFQFTSVAFYLSVRVTDNIVEGRYAFYPHYFFNPFNHAKQRSNAVTALGYRIPACSGIPFYTVYRKGKIAYPDAQLK